MAYIAPIHQPSAVRHALKLNLLDPEEESLVVAYAGVTSVEDVVTDQRHSANPIVSRYTLKRLKA